MRTAVFTGIGLHSGKSTRIKVIVSDVLQHGIVFELLNHGRARVPARWNFVSSTNHCTTLRHDTIPTATVSTVEHLLAAMSMCNIQNALVEVEGPEIPILDGSSIEFIRGFRDNGMVGNRSLSSGSAGSAGSASSAGSSSSFIRVRKPVHQTLENGTMAWLLPHASVHDSCTEEVVYGGGAESSFSPRLSLSVDVDFSTRKLARRIVAGSLKDDDFIHQVASARTFTFKEDYDMLIKSGLAGGGSLDNAVLFHNGQPLNDHGLRHPYEYAWHKMLDCVGDLTLAGMPIHGHYHAVKPGHGLNVSMIQELMSTDGNYDIVERIN